MMLTAAQTTPVARSSLQQSARRPTKLPHRARPAVHCAATRKGGGGRKKAEAASTGPQTPPEADAATARADAADSAKSAIEDAGEQLADAVGSGVQDAGGAVADTQAQAAGTAARAESAADDALLRARADEVDAAIDAATTAADARRQAAGAAADTRDQTQVNAAQAEDAVQTQASEIAGAVAEGVEAVPTPAEVVQGAADGAADVIRGVGQAAGQASAVASQAQSDAEGLASDLQREASRAATELQAGLNDAAAEAQRAGDALQQEARRIAANASGGTEYRRGRSLISDTAPLTAMSSSAPGGKSGEEAVPHLKARLLAHVAGLDRGFAATGRQAELVEAAVQDLVAAAPLVDLLSSPAPPALANATPVSVSTAGTSVISITPAPGAAAAAAPTTSSDLALPPPGAGLADGAAAPGSPGAVGPAFSAAAAASGATSTASPASGAAPGSRTQREQLGGLWRLVYSSGFAGKRSTGGRRPGVPIRLLPADFGQVYQGIDAGAATLDNVVELRRGPLPSLPFGPRNQAAEALLTLKHSYAVTGPRTVQITFTGTDVSLQGGVAGLLNNVPEFTLPELPAGLQPKTSRGLRSSTFDVLFLDEDLRVTRGDRGEVRVFLRT